MPYSGHLCANGIGCDKNRKYNVNCFKCARAWNFYCLLKEDSAIESWISSKNAIQRCEVFFKDSCIQFVCPACMYNVGSGATETSNTTMEQHVTEHLKLMFDGFKVDTLKQLGDDIDALKQILAPAIDFINLKNEMQHQINRLNSVVEHAVSNSASDEHVRKRKKAVARNATEAMDVASVNTDTNVVSHNTNVSGDMNSQTTSATTNDPPLVNDLIGFDGNLTAQIQQQAAQSVVIGDHEAGLLRPPTSQSVQNGAHAIQPPYNIEQLNRKYECHIHISPFNIGTTADDIVKHIVSHTAIRDNSLFKVTPLTRKNNKAFDVEFVSFKISSSSEVIKLLSMPMVWPSFVKAREFKVTKSHSTVRKNVKGKHASKYNRTLPAAGYSYSFNNAMTPIMPVTPKRVAYAGNAKRVLNSRRMQSVVNATPTSRPKSAIRPNPVVLQQQQQQHFQYQQQPAFMMQPIMYQPTVSSMYQPYPHFLMPMPQMLPSRK